MRHQRIFVGTMIGLVAVPLAWMGAPREIAKFHIARSRNAEWQRDWQVALEATEAALAWTPGEPRWWLRKAELLLEKGNAAEAQSILRHARTLPGCPDAWVELWARAALAEGNPAEALRVWKAHGPPIPPVEPREPQPEGLLARWLSGDTGGSRRLRRAILLNARAYYRALAQQELEEALADAKHAVESVWDDRAVIAPLAYLALSAGVSYQDTTATMKGAAHFEFAVRTLRSMVHRLQVRVSALRHPRSGRLDPNRQERVERLKAMLIVAHIELVRTYQSLGRDEAARQHGERARRLAPGADLETLRWGISLDEAIADVSRLASFLDTRGMVWLARGELAPAGQDLARAVRLGQALERAGSWWRELVGRRELDTRQEEAQLREMRRALAVFHYHRSLVRRRRGRTREADRDLEAVRALGFVPGPALH